MIMAAYGLQFEKQSSSRSSKQFDEKDTFHLEPAIDLFASYDFGEVMKKRTPLSNESKLNLFLEIRSLMLKHSQSQLQNPSSSIPSQSKTMTAIEAESRGIKRDSENLSDMGVSVPSNKRTKVSGSMVSFFKVSLSPPPLPLTLAGQKLSL